MTTLEKIQNKSARIGILGLGYVGLPLALNFNRNGYKVLGLDIDTKKTTAINEGRSYIEHIPPTEIVEARAKGLLEATTDFSQSSSCDALIICVPTPLDHHHAPDLSFVINTVEAVLPYIRAGQVMSLESTTYPGTTKEELQPRIEAKGFTIGQDYFLLFSPEREDPGNKDFPSHKIPKIVGGTTPACIEVGEALYKAAFENIVPVTSPAVAEFAKLLENIYRSVNIGLVNEMKMVADKMGIDVWEVINAAATKPFGFKAFYPGPGIGGHCIPVDPFYLTWKAKEYGIHTRFIEIAGEINEAMPEYVVRRTAEVLSRTKKKALNGARILVMGLAYKADVDDERESPSFHILDQLLDHGAEPEFYDPHVPQIRPVRKHPYWRGRKSAEWSEASVKSYDAVIISTWHSKFNKDELLAWADTIIDTRNALAGANAKPGQVTKA
jgi:UDP-N-acetyl-D-glucosamine dehydrogenase